MKTLGIIIGVVMLCLIGMLGHKMVHNVDEDRPIGSVVRMGEYKYAQYTGAISTSTLIQTGVSTLGSVIITEDFAGTLMFYDATSTDAVGNGLTTTVADMQSALTEGVYTFDVSLYRGLVMVSADGFSFAGDITVTFR